MLNIEWIILYIALGSFVGFMSGLLGVGGGGLLVPLFASIFIYQGFSADSVVHLALGTSLACMIISSASSLRAHAYRGAVMWDVVKGMTPGIILGAFIATQIASHVNSSYIAIFFALFMALVALQTFIKWQPKPSHKPRTLLGLIMSGLGIGAISALAAVGGGFLTVVYLGYKNVDIKRSIGTSAAIGFPIAITGTIGYMINGWAATMDEPYTFGFIYIPAFLAISISSAISAPYGARRSHNMPEANLKKIFAIICMVLSIKMLVSFW
ncbi:sulfite exporter TauE/SafE family protein [Methylotenera versatilis]|uniref:Probable membrane transporter protein n=1 Tax=Methylotenera versatilis (strain 301) TaxID=666681 RepID=D7DJF9_METV0|nr:sulfite exporter TauE/SafE family protein [Methylotenera versatilis]ADI30194.1 protein of unknown function DUF81 [Methylotenera versatilis 301]